MSNRGRSASRRAATAVRNDLHRKPLGDRFSAGVQRPVAYRAAPAHRRARLMPRGLLRGRTAIATPGHLPAGCRSAVWALVQPVGGSVGPSSAALGVLALAAWGRATAPGPRHLRRRSIRSARRGGNGCGRRRGSIGPCRRPPDYGRLWSRRSDTALRRRSTAVVRRRPRRPAHRWLPTARSPRRLGSAPSRRSCPLPHPRHESTHYASALVSRL